ncbi:hypothetical protein [Candidatus Entotheonella palauensis]|uniref:Uncharacterized protein n=1 Tax=Candidatus Entotheonella gemina TaxID=1429439 RepID=W4M588_9BACT|nr:hypothetical protein [Candidatus Entotheonella palauensis]ETX05514.1 MAG: hypothetical protein ETSY2_22485 [Candidatus Entotheonella gemina]
MRYQFLTLVFVLAVGSALLGCSGGGGDEQTMTEDCRGGSINNSVNSQVSEIATGLTFDFTDGDIFHPDLAGTAVMFTFDMFNDPVLTILLATPDFMASGEVEIEGCNLITQPVCPFGVTIIESDFPAGEGPQTGEVLELQNWLFSAFRNTCTNRIVATLTIGDTTGRAVASEPLDLDIDRLRPML